MLSAFREKIKRTVHLCICFGFHEFFKHLHLFFLDFRWLQGLIFFDCFFLSSWSRFRWIGAHWWQPFGFLKLFQVLWMFKYSRVLLENGTISGFFADLGPQSWKFWLRRCPHPGRRFSAVPIIISFAISQTFDILRFEPGLLQPRTHQRLSFRIGPLFRKCTEIRNQTLLTNLRKNIEFLLRLSDRFPT